MKVLLVLVWFILYVGFGVTLGECNITEPTIYTFYGSVMGIILLSILRE